MENGKEVVEVERVVREVFAAFQRHDSARIEELQAENCTVWDVFTPELLVGREDLRRFHVADQEQSSSRGPLQLSLGNFVTDVFDDVAVVRYLVRFSYAPPNEASGTVRITDVLRRLQGGWVMVHHHEGLVPAR